MTKHGGILGALETAGLVEAPEEPAEVSAPQSAPPVVSYSQPVSTPSPNYQFAGMSFGQPTPTLDADDQARLKTLEAQVYAAPSTYRIFQGVRASLGNSPDLRQVFSVLAAANPGVTPQKVMTDIDAHLGVIAAKGAEFSAQLTQARSTRIDGPTAEIASLTEQNQAAAQQIAERAARITQLQQAMQAAEKALSDGAARFKVIEDQLSAPLLQAKQQLSSLT